MATEKGEVQNVVGFANCALPRFGKNVEWSWQKGNNYNPIDAFNALNQDSLKAISLSFCSLDK